MKFILEVETNAKRNTGKVLDRIIVRASDAVMKERTVQSVEIKGREVEEEDS